MVESTKGLFLKGANLVHEGSMHKLITQRPHLQIPLYWALGFKHNGFIDKQSIAYSKILETWEIYMINNWWILPYNT